MGPGLGGPSPIYATDEDACTYTISNNDVMEINVTNEYDNTIKSGIIDEDMRSEVTDFNLENDQIDHNKYFM